MWAESLSTATSATQTEESLAAQRFFKVAVQKTSATQLLPGLLPNIRRGGGAYDCVAPNDPAFPSFIITSRRKQNMRFPVFYGRTPKLSIKDVDNFSRGDYKCRVLLQTKRGAPVAISEHKDTGIWKVQHGFSTVVFATKADAMAYCKDRFLDLDGRAV